jgi:hypothetical protein
MTPTERRIRTRPKLLALVREVADERFVTVAEVCSRCRTKAVALARHECWWHMREQGWSNVETGKLWGVDSGTVLMALRGFEG